MEKAQGKNPVKQEQPQAKVQAGQNLLISLSSVTDKVKATEALNQRLASLGVLASVAKAK